MSGNQELRGIKDIAQILEQLIICIHIEVLEVIDRQQTNRYQVPSIHLNDVADSLYIGVSVVEYGVIVRASAIRPMPMAGDGHGDSFGTGRSPSV